MVESDGDAEFDAELSFDFDLDLGFSFSIDLALFRLFPQGMCLSSIFSFSYVPLLNLLYRSHVEMDRLLQTH